MYDIVLEKRKGEQVPIDSVWFIQQMKGSI